MGLPRNGIACNFNRKMMRNHEMYLAGHPDFQAGKPIHSEERCDERMGGMHIFPVEYDMLI
jgi:hypothetical protein